MTVKAIVMSLALNISSKSQTPSLAHYALLVSPYPPNQLVERFCLYAHGSEPGARCTLTKSSFHTGSSNESLAEMTKAASRQGCQFDMESVKRELFTARST